MWHVIVQEFPLFHCALRERQRAMAASITISNTAIVIVSYVNLAKSHVELNSKFDVVVVAAATAVTSIAAAADAVFIASALRRTQRV